MKCLKINIKKNYKKLILLSVLVLFVSLIIGGTIKYLNDTKIDRILETASYSYLPKEAKNYIKEVYEKTGNIILTEKNKKENTPYLNSEYVEYISLSQEEKEQVAVIPETFAVDYVFNKSYGSEESLPSSYDSRNVDGKNYVTEIRDQGGLDVCWTFATAETAETYLLVTKKETVTANSQLFSERQLDYATSNDGIKDYQSEYRSFIDRKLGSGGNFFVATTALANGISLADASWKTYDDTDMSQMELHEVLNYDNSLYELNTSINMSRLNVLDLDMTKEENIKLREQYINTIKENIMKYGSAFVGTGSPNSSDGCAYYDSTLKNYVISVDKTCSVKAHAMQIIGWDDSISYSYCADNASKHTTSSSCTNKVSGTGVWILRNSWGTESSSAYPYPYLAYDSYNTDISFITDLDASYEKTWDNNYVLGDTFEPVLSTEKTFDLDVNNNEKITKLKFMSYSQNASYDVEIIVDGKKINEVYKVSNSQPGLVTLDLSNKNITFKDGISIKVTGKNNSLLLAQLYLFTTNVEETASLSFNTDKSLVIDKVNIRLYSTTRNIDSNSNITYKIYNKANEDVSDKMTYENNIVAENNVNASITLDETLPKGDYKIDAIFEEKVLDSIYIINEISGSGTEKDPYVITNSTQLYDIRDELDAYYILGNDIDLTEDTRKGGKYYNDGKGWVGAWDFSGTLDGKGHTIKGAWMAKHNYTSGGYGLFRSLAGNVTIKNLVIEDFDITCDYWCGAVAGIYGDALGYDPENGTNNININNIVIRNSSIEGYNPTAYENAQNHRIGGLIGGIFAPNSDVNLSNIYMDTTVDFTYESMYYAGAYRDVKGGAGLIRDVQANNFTMRNIQINGSVKRPDTLIDNIVANNDVQEYIINTADKTADLSRLTKRETYSSWANFDDNWVMKTVDGIPRIPILKIAADDFEYTSANDITIDLATTEYPSIYDYIVPDTSLAHRISYEMEDNHVAFMDGSTIKPVSPGAVTVHVKNYYDGYERDVKVNVTYSSQNPYYIVVFDPNGVDKDITSTIFNIRNTGNTLTANPYTKYNYNFLGWNTKADGSGTSYADKENITPDVENGEVIVLYAQWEPIKMTITFDPNGGTIDQTTKEVRYDDTYGQLPIPVRDGYGFDGWEWRSGNILYYFDKVTRNEDFTVTAKWIEDAYTIVYNSNGSTDVTRTSYSKYGEDYKIYQMHSYRKGYTFSGYNTKADGTGTTYQVNDIINFDDVENSVFNLYAQWKSEYSVKYDANGGTGTMNNQTFEHTNAQALTQNTYIRTGYTFSGWNTKSDGTGTSYSDGQIVTDLTTNIETITLYAQWQPNSYDVIFNANGGTGIMNNQTFTYDLEQALRENEYTKDKYIFIGWNTKSDGTGTSYSNKEKVKNLTTEESITLYAQWSEETSYVVNKYTLDEENKYIDLIPIKTTLDDYKKNITLGSGVTLQLDLGTNSYIYTGSKTKIYKDTDLLIELTNIVRGDINSDGKISALDYVMIRNHIMDNEIITDDIFIKAADADLDNKISALDYVTIRMIIMEGAN